MKIWMKYVANRKLGVQFPEERAAGCMVLHIAASWTCSSRKNVLPVERSPATRKAKLQIPAKRIVY